ncbi:calponin homology domain-containing protein [Calycina marina]|uniref:Calponin homology domain-containing protein n=1 Tax=Calycina marina TaxID=1763456 RepID=A0A9P7Z8N4_9HELO|nr:calponin homology domain-containing protein [Calycina marina]
MGESRQELVAWLNNLLQLNVTKVEQCGTGAALCQIFDSIYLDVPMNRVKFNVNTEYAYLQNFKILQNCFTRHGIDRPVNVEQLIKCKMQDNLEFLQWSKRYWDQYFPGGDYDAVARRRTSGAPPAAAPAARTSAGASRRGTTPTTGPRVPKSAVGGGAGSAALKAENETLKETVQGLERERDFYFSKLRDIELLVQQACDEDPELEKDEEGLIKHIQTILYSTEDGFEIPAEAEADEETF